MKNFTNEDYFILGILYASEKYNSVRNDKAIGNVSCGDVADFLFMESQEISKEDISDIAGSIFEKYFA